MSQYPSPYQPPNPQMPMNFDYYRPQGDALAPARRASMLMFLLAGTTLIGGMCCAVGGVMFPQVMQEKPEILSEMQRIPGFTVDILRTVLFVAAGITFLLGFAQMLLGYFVRRASKPAIITSMVIAAIAILWFALNVVSSIVRIGSMGTQGPLAICFSAIPLSLYVLLMIWLIGALRSADAVRATRDQYAAQYWQHMYQQQMYSQQAGGGYPAQPPQQPPPIQQPPLPPPPA